MIESVGRLRRSGSRRIRRHQRGQPFRPDQASGSRRLRHTVGRHPRKNFNQSTYLTEIREIGAPSRSRTCDLPLRRGTLYPTELPGRAGQLYRIGARMSGAPTRDRLPSPTRRSRPPAGGATGLPYTRRPPRLARRQFGASPNRVRLRRRRGHRPGQERPPRHCDRADRHRVQTINPGAYYTGYNETMTDAPFHWLDGSRHITRRAALRQEFGGFLQAPEGHLHAREMIDRMIEIVPADTGRFRNVVHKPSRTCSSATSSPPRTTPFDRTTARGPRAAVSLGSARARRRAAAARRCLPLGNSRDEPGPSSRYECPVWTPNTAPWRVIEPVTCLLGRSCSGARARSGPP